MTRFLANGNSPVSAVHFFIKGLIWLAKPPLRRFLIVPIAINFSLYSVAFALGYFYLPPLVAHAIPSWLDWLTWLIKPLFFISFIVVGYFTFSLLANLIAAPFYGVLAEKTQALLWQAEGIAAPENPAPPSSTMMWGELKRLGYLLKWMTALVAISLIPGLNLLAPLLWAMFGAWACALEFFAYPLENQGLAFQAQKSLLQSRRFGTLSFGGLVMLGLSVPLLNTLISPAAVIAATLYSHAIRQASTMP